MRERPKLTDEQIVSAVHTHYGLAVDKLFFLPLGNDIATSAFRIEAVDGTPYFLKVRAHEGFSIPSLTIPRYLCDQGLSGIPAPIRTLRHTLWVDLGEFALALYPYIEGHMGRDDLSAERWHTFGALMRKVHSQQLPSELYRVVKQESYIPSRRDMIDDLQAVMNSVKTHDAVATEFITFWRIHEDVIQTLVCRADALGEHLRRNPSPHVLCHADMHVWNLLVDTELKLWLVDWDEVIFAPKERDLMFVIGGIGGYQPDTESFLAGYGEAPIDPVALAYYRYAWAVQDIAAYGEQVFFRPDLSEESRREGLLGFTAQFSSGGIVERALTTPLLPSHL